MTWTRWPAVAAELASDPRGAELVRVVRELTDAAGRGWRGTYGAQPPMARPTWETWRPLPGSRP